MRDSVRHPLFRLTRELLRALTLAGLLPAAAFAVPAVEVSWDQCEPIVTTKIPGPGEVVQTLFVTATGLTETHTGYEVRLWFASEMPCQGPASTPDAWRFDTEGCQEMAPEMRITPPLGTCPAMWGTGSEPISIRQVVYEPIDFVTPPGAMRAVCAVSYTGAPQTPDPGQRYFLFLLRFDHTNSVTGPGTPGLTCGGYESPMCFALWSGVTTLVNPCSYARSTQMHYSDTNLVEHPLEPGDHAHATFALDPAASMSCFELVSAQSRTWGAIKAQYR